MRVATDLKTIFLPCTRYMLFLLFLFLPGAHSVFATAEFPSYQEDATRPLNIVYFNSYHEGYKWSDDVQKGIKDTFNNPPFKRPIHFYSEYMDTKRISNDDYLNQLAKMYKVKYGGIDVDLIMSSDDSAFNFLDRHRSSIFPDIPYVFCGVNYFDPRQVTNPHAITGVNETAGIDETLKLIFDLHPETETILIINDQTDTGLKVQAELLKETALYADRAFFEFADNLTYSEIIGKVKNLKSNSVILYTFFFRDAANHFYENSEVISQLGLISNVPIYSTWDFNLGLGITGGMLTSGYYQGRKAAEMAIRILSGVDIDQMPVVMESPRQYFFDYNLLEQQNISLSALPVDSIVINAPETIFQFYEKNKLIVFTSISVFLASIVAILLFTGFKIHRSNQKLLYWENRYRTIFEYTGTAMMIVKNDTTILMVNSGFEKLSGYDRNDVEEKMSWRQFIHPADKTKMVAYHGQRRIDGEKAPSSYEFRFIPKDGNQRHIFITVGMIEGTDQSVASMLDITRRIQTEKEKEVLITKLQRAIKNIKTLKGLLPICSHCKKIRNDEGYWRQIEEFVQEHSSAQFSHGICPDCLELHYPEYDLD